MIMPFGFFGDAAFLIFVAAAVPLGYAFVWPGGVQRTWLFLSIAIVVAVVAGLASFFWTISPLGGIGISDQVSPGSVAETSFMAQLRWRFYIAACALVLMQVVLSWVLRAWLSR
jgi:hypothetical protein